MLILPVNREEHFPGATLVVMTLIAANCLVMAGINVNYFGDHVYRDYGFVPADPHLSTVLTALFIHVGLLHLLVNMWFLWTFGPPVEAALGRIIFAIAYVICGVGGDALHWVMNAQATIPAVGASGAISGIMGIYLVLFPRSRFVLRWYYLAWKHADVSSSAYILIGIWIVNQLGLALTVDPNASDVVFLPMLAASPLVCS